jgi:uncharacterized protein (DUF885 family)
MQISRRVLLEGTAATALALGMPAYAAVPSGDADLKAGFDTLADELLTAAPEGASYLGLDTGKHADLKSKLGDCSRAAIDDSCRRCGEWIGKLSKVPAKMLSPAIALDRDVIVYALELGRDAAPFGFGDNSLETAMNEASTPYVVSQESGNFVGTPEFLNSQHSIETKADCDAYLARVEAFAVTLDQETDRVKHDVAAGVVPPDFLLHTATGQMTKFLALKPDEQGLVKSLVTRAAAKGIAGDYSAPATKLVAEKVYPAVQRQLDTLNTALAHATHDAGVWKFKGGEAYYAWCLKVGTTTTQSAAEIHKTGLEQVKAIEARMDAILKKQGISKGGVGARMTALASDPRFLFADNDTGRADMLTYLNKLIAEVRAVMPKASRLRLKAPVIVKRVPADIEDGAGLGYMNSGSLDGKRPSTYYINLKTTANWPRYSLPTLTHHETIPGHAWQGAYVTETGKLPLIRILLSGFNAYVEGWALYAEQLSDELGLYAHDPFGQLGYLQEQQLRAVRLVVDTGLHAFKWSREKAIDFAVDKTGEPRDALTSEIDRYCGTPGQACGYKVGHNEILRLRALAQKRLGARYDLRDFDDWVVEAGAVPLTVLDRIVAGRIAARMKGRA